MTRLRLARDLWAIDIGNSKVSAVLYRGGRARGRWRLATPRSAASRSAPRWAARWRAIVATAAARGNRVPAVIASVQPAHVPIVRAGLRAAGVTRVHVARWSDPWPFAIAVDEPRRVGIDRLANVAGFLARGFRDGVIVDAGTAITIDVVKRGAFAGGLILPGLRLAAAALHAHTALLPVVDAAAPPTPPLVGRNTRQAIRAGIHHTTIRGVRAVARDLARQLGPTSRVVYTGGQGAAFRQGRGRLDPDLQARGLRVLAALRGLDAKPNRQANKLK